MGNVDFQINEHEVLINMQNETLPKQSFINLSIDQITIPGSNAQSQTIEITGFVVNYTRGNTVELIVLNPDNSTSTEKNPCNINWSFFHIL